MQGVWVFDEEKSIIKRDSNYSIENIFFITKENIDLPHILLGKIEFDSTMTKEDRNKVKIKRIKN